jgi:hypothetical protein
MNHEQRRLKKLRKKDFLRSRKKHPDKRIVAEHAMKKISCGKKLGLKQMDKTDFSTGTELRTTTLLNFNHNHPHH